MSLLFLLYIIQGAKNLAKPPTLTEMLHATLEKAETEDSLSKEEKKDEEDNEAEKRGLKRKLDLKQNSDDQEGEVDSKGNGNGPNEMEKIKKAKNVGNPVCILLNLY